MIRRPRLTLARALESPRTVPVASAILTIAVVCTVAFLSTPVGRLAALDQQVRQLESFGVQVDDGRYEAMRENLIYRPALSGAAILVGWPLGWILGAAVVRWVGNWMTARRVTLARVVTVLVHASAILALRAIVAAPLNYARESVGGATSAAMLLPSFSESSFVARLLSAVDLFAVWWLILVAMGLGMVYERPTLHIGRWLFTLYVAAAAVLALIQALRGGI